MFKRFGWLTLAMAVVTAALAIGVGAAAPTFKLRGTDGQDHALAEQRDKAKAVVLIWVSVECPVSRDYDGRMAALAKEYGPKGVVFYGINSNRPESFEVVAKHAKEKLGFVVLKDEGAKVADAYEASRTPEVFVLDKSLKVKYHGAIDNSQREDRVEADKRYARQAIEAVLAGRNPDPAETPFKGCTIKR